MGTPTRRHPEGCRIEQRCCRVTGITDISRIGRFRIGDKLGVTEFKDRDKLIAQFRMNI